MATTNDLKNGMTLNLDGNLMNVVEFQHVKPGKGGAFVRTKLKNVRTGRTLDKTFRADEPVEVAIGVELPAAVELQVTETEPGVKGDRVSGATKPATVETGALVQVPLFVETGDRIKVDTRSGAYLTRVQ
jgi:elongation factor P